MRLIMRLGLMKLQSKNGYFYFSVQLRFSKEKKSSSRLLLFL